MSDQTPNDPDWLDEFQELANRELGEGSACEQVHPIVENWYHQLMHRETLASRDAVLQAMSCLSTEVLSDAPGEVLEEVLKHIDEEALASWVEYVLMIGRAFESALRSGELDDL